MKTSDLFDSRKTAGLLVGFGLSAGAAAASLEDLETKTNIEFAVVEGVSLKLDAMVPKSKGPHPAIVYVHGGGFTGGDKKDYDRSATTPLIEKGFGVISVNYRLAPKYPFPAATDDVESALHYIKTHSQDLNIDPDRLVLMGASAGGHLVSFVGVKHRPENRVAAVVSFFGEHDIVARTAENPCIMDGKIVPVSHGGCLSPGLAAFLGISEVSDQTARIIKEASPVTYVNHDMPPYLLIHGTRDFNVPFDQSLIMSDAMMKVEADCTVLPVIGAGHGGFEKTPAMREYKKKMIDWILAHTQQGR